MFRKPVLTLSFILALVIHSQAQLFYRDRPRSLEGGAGKSNYGAMAYAGYVQYFTKRDMRPRPRTMSLTPNYDRAYPCTKRTMRPDFLFPNHAYGKLSLYYEGGSGTGVKYSTVGLDAAVFYGLIKIGNVAYINAKGGLTISSDKLRNPLTVVDNDGNPVQNSYNTTKYGALFGCEGELLLSSRVTLVAGVDQRFLLDTKETWGTKRWYGYAGLRFNIR